MEQAIQFLLKIGDEADRAAIQALLAKHSMAADLSPSEFLQAEIGGRVAGAARLEWEERRAYIRPIMVEPAWSRKGIGRLLVRSLSQGLDSVHVVARGRAAGF